MKIAFFWHWQKKINPEGTGLAIKDSIIHAAGKLAQDHSVTIFSIDSKGKSRQTFCEEHNVHYEFRNNVLDLMEALKEFSPQIAMMNHHPEDYFEIRKQVQDIVPYTGVYITAPLEYMSDWNEFDFIFTNHQYQADTLESFGVHGSKLWISPKTADEDIFIATDTPKKWDIVYPSRGDIGYWKRPELVIDAAKKLGLSVVLPGSNVNPEAYDHVTVLGWLTPKELSEVYNQSRLLVITSNEREMGPRVIPEAVMCNLPFVVCKDSPACLSYANQLGGFIARPRVRSVAKQISKALKSDTDFRRKALEIGMDVEGNYRIFIEIIRRLQ